MLDSPAALLLLVPGILLTTFSLAYAFQKREDRAAAQRRCPQCRQELNGQPAFCPDCGARSRC